MVDYESIVEFYISVFFRHLYYDQSVTRDIHIVHSTSAMHGGGTDAAKAGSSAKTNKYEVILKYRNGQQFGFNLENYRFELLLQSIRPEKIV